MTTFTFFLSQVISVRWYWAKQCYVSIYAIFCW